MRDRKLTSVNVRLYSIHHCIAACGVSLPKVKAAAGGVFTVLSQYDNTISRLHAVEARAAVSDAPDEEKEEMEKVYS